MAGIPKFERKKQIEKRLRAPEGMSFCSRCDSYKDIIMFSICRSRKSGIATYCKSCASKRESKVRERRDGLKRERRYGISIAEYNALLEKQGGVCDICKLPETRIHKGVLAFLSVDHDHDTGKIRGLLCGACNVAIGYFRDDKERMKSAIDYLTRNGK